MSENCVGLLIAFLLLSLLMALKRIKSLQRQLQAADRLLAIQQDIMRHQYRLATGGAFAGFINSLEMDLDRETGKNAPKASKH